MYRTRRRIQKANARDGILQLQKHVANKQGHSYAEEAVHTPSLVHAVVLHLGSPPPGAATEPETTGSHLHVAHPAICQDTPERKHVGNTCSGRRGGVTHAVCGERAPGGGSPHASATLGLSPPPPRFWTKEWGRAHCWQTHSCLGLPSRLPPAVGRCEVPRGGPAPHWQVSVGPRALPGLMAPVFGAYKKRRLVPHTSNAWASAPTGLQGVREPENELILASGPGRGFEQRGRGEAG